MPRAQVRRDVATFSAAMTACGKGPGGKSHGTGETRPTMTPFQPSQLIGKYAKICQARGLGLDLLISAKRPPSFGLVRKRQSIEGSGFFER